MLDGIDRPVPGPRPRRIPVEDLSVYESRGGHTLRRHVDTRPGDEMRRILHEGVAAAGRFVSRATAQRCVDIAVTRRSARDRLVAQRQGQASTVHLCRGHG